MRNTFATGTKEKQLCLAELSENLINGKRCDYKTVNHAKK